MTRIADVARTLNVSGMTIRRHLERKRAILGTHIREEGGITTISDEGIGILRESVEASSVRPLHRKEPATAVSTPPATISPEISNRLEAMEKAIMLLVDENRATREENRNLRADVAVLRQRLEPPVLALDFLNEPVKAVAPWHPSREKPKFSGWQRLWFKIFDPSRLRAIEH